MPPIRNQHLVSCSTKSALQISNQEAEQTTAAIEEDNAYYEEDSDDNDNIDDDLIRDALKRELLFIASVTNRGEYASDDEQNLVVDLITQLEALNPTLNPASNSQGDWDLCLSSTHVFQSSPLFMIALENNDGFDGGDTKISSRKNNNHNTAQVSSSSSSIAQNMGRKIATSSTQIGRVRQSIASAGDELVNEVDVTIGPLPGVPRFLGSFKGTIITTATINYDGDDEKTTVDLQIKNTQVKSNNGRSLTSSLPLPFDQLLPMTEVYNTLIGPVPAVTLKTCYVDEGIRITRDMGDNFLVFSRATE